MSSVFEDPVDLAHHVHGIGGQMLQKLAAKDCGEVGRGIREAVLFGIEQIDFAREMFAGFRGGNSPRRIVRLRFFVAFPLREASVDYNAPTKAFP